MILDYSPWLIIPVVAAGIGYAALLYFRNRKQPYSKPLTRLLFLLRMLLVMFVGLLLLSPYFVQLTRNIEQPIIVLVHDNSASLLLTKDSVFYKTEYLQKLDSLKDALIKDYAVDEYIFGKDFRLGASIDFNDQQTVMSDMFSMLRRTYFKRNVGAVLLFSDGIVNAGYQPDVAATSFPFKVITIALGDTIQNPDLAISDIRFNKTVLINSTFPVEVTCKATNAAGKNMRIALFSNDSLIDEPVIKVNGNNATITKTFLVDAKKAGISQYTISVSGIEDEAMPLNNKRSFFVEVIDQKQKILFFAKAPHPDIAAIAEALGDRFDVDIRYLRDGLPANEKSYDLVILHQIPSGQLNLNALQQYLSLHEEMPLLIITGATADLASLNQLQDFIHITPNEPQSGIEAFANLDPAFSLFQFELPDQLATAKLPPLLTPFANYRFDAPGSVLFKQEIRSVSTNNPLVAFSSGQGRKYGFIAGTGLWRWRNFAYSNLGSHRFFDGLIAKTIQYLIVRQDQSLLKLNMTDEYDASSEIVIDAELRNRSNELIQQPDLTMDLTNEKDGKSVSYLFARTATAYQLKLGRLPEGIYRYEARAEIGEEIAIASGKFIVTAASLEARNLVADFSVMRRIAQQTSGIALSQNDLDKIPEILSNDASISSVSHEEERFKALINYQTALLLLVLLVSAEWILRKTFGAY